MTAAAKDHSPQVKAPKEKRLSHPIKGNQHRKKRLLNRPGGFFDRRPLRVIALALLLTIIAAPSLLPKFSVVDNDIWWHLKVGDWIIQHSAFPHTGILSRTAADRPWMAYSWIYEVLLSFFHYRFHLMGVAVYGLLLTFAVTYSVFWMTRCLANRFWGPSLLATLCCAAFLFRIYPRPAFFSMMFFAILLTLLLEARRTGRLQMLYWLPPLFLVWANAHIQFIYGLFVVALFVSVNLALKWASHRGLATDFLYSPLLPSRTLLVLLGACVLATCVGPYSYHLYSVIFKYATSKYPYTYIEEFQALHFRSYIDFVQLLLALSAFFVLVRRRPLDPFLLSLLLVATLVGFRTARDAWFICIPATACLAEAFRSPSPKPRKTIIEKTALAVVLAVLILLYARLLNVNTRDMRLAIASHYPVRAINFLRDHPQPGPLYNTFNWGGFIAWYMPDYPVAIDGRTDLYGDEIDMRFYKTENGDPSYADDRYLNESRLVVLPRETPLARLLNSDTRFTVIYSDPLSMVFVKQ
ncbi:MAG: hypothetical protein WBV69_04595 [Candidatus Sulfotelmatobacter sp.]